MKGLLSVGFGTSHADTRAKTIDAIEADLRAEFSDCAFFSAWTSGRIVEKVRRERGEHHDTLDEAFARITEAGVDDLVVATTCLMYGHEMDKIARAAHAWAAGTDGADGKRFVHMAAPLLASEADRQAMARVLADEFSAVPQDDALLFMGHGSQDAPTNRDGKPFDANAVYSCVQDALHSLGKTRFFVATVEGAPSFEDAFDWVRQSGVARVHLAPFMIVAGDHAKNDLAGDDADSWKSRLESQGLQVEVVLRGLGEYPGVRSLVCAHARDAYDVREAFLRG